MKDQILKIAGVKSEKEFYKKYPTEEAFMKAHGKAFQKAAMGKSMVAKQLTQLTDFANPPQAEVGAYIGGDTYKNANFKYGDFADEADASVTGYDAPVRVQNVQPPMGGAQKNPYAFNAGTTGMQNIDFEKVGADILPQLMQMQGGGIISAQGGVRIPAFASTIPTRTPTNAPAANMTNIGNMLSNPAFQQNATNRFAGLGTQPTPSLGSQIGSGIINNAGNILQGINMLKDEKRQKQMAKQSAALTGVVGKAAGTRSEISKRKYVRPEDMSVQPGQLGNPYGEGTNPLIMQDGGGIGGNPTEIQNTFAPNVIYTNLEYEPLNDSKVKQYKKGGKLNKAQTGAGIAGQLGGGVGSVIGGGKFNQAGGAGKIGGTVGGIVGSVIPGVGTVIGSAAGSLIGGFIGGKSAKETARLQEEAQNNIMGSALQQGAKSIQSNYSGFMEDGGWVSNDWQPQVIASFGEYKMKDLLKPPYDADMLRAGGSVGSGYYTPPSERAMQTYDMGGELETHWGGYMEPMSQNPYLPDGGVTVMPRGQSHSESDGKGNTGIGITFGDNPVEVERGEPMVKLKDGGTGEDNLVVFGNMKIPNYALDEFEKKAKGKKFKSYATDLTKTEAKQTKLIDKSTKKIDDLEVLTSFDRLEADSLQANLIGANMKLKDIADKKQKLGDLQQSIHSTAPEYGYDDVDEFNNDVIKGSVKIKKGKVESDVPMAQYGFDVKSIVPQVNVNNQRLKPIPSAYPNNSPVQKLIKSIVPQVQPTANFPLRQGFMYNPPAYLYQNVPAVNYNVGAGLPTVSALNAPTALNMSNAGSPGFQPTGSTLPIPIGPDEEDIKKDFIFTRIGDFINENLGDESLIASELLPYLRPTNQMDLDPIQLAGEMDALADNQVEPVFAQTLQPRLGSPIDISLQSALNANQADYNALIRNVGYNPAAQSLLAAQKYAANSEILGKESQMNKEEKARVYDANRQLLNEYDLKNAIISDTQQVRQSTALSKTKEQRREALKSIGDKYLENRRENRTLGIYENEYKFRYDNQGRLINMNPLARFTIPTASGKPSGISNTDVLPVYDKDNKEVVAYKQKAKNGNIVKAIKNL